MNNIIKEWIDRLCVGRLPAKWTWVSYFQKLWAKLQYGLGVNFSPVSYLEKAEKLGGFLCKHYRRMLPLLGVNCNIKGEWSHLPSTFCSMGLQKLLAEVVITWINLFLQHYGTPSTLGTKLDFTIQHLQLEVGTNV